MHTIVIAAQKPFSKNSVAKIQELFKAYEANYKLVLCQSYATKEDLYAQLGEAEALIVRSDKVDTALLEHAPALKVIVRAGAGYDTIDLAACSAKGIVVMNTPGQNANAVAEVAFGLAIMAIRRGFTGKSGNELRGRKLGLQAYGAVARAVAAIAKGFGMEVYSFDPFVKAEVMEAAGIKACKSLEELYSTCNVISIHTPLTDSTRGCVNAAILDKMAADGVLINTARAEVVDEAALMAKMEKCSAFCYAADVAPKTAAEFVEKFGERCAFSKIKSGAQTEEANTNCGCAAIKQIVAFFEKGDCTFQVNKAK